MPSFTSYLALAALTSFASAITINEPSKNTIWDSAKENKITWDSVNTDPQTVDIYLAHMSGQPALYSLLFENVDISKKSEVVSDLQLPTGIAYQINFVAHNKPEQIYAQSQQFNVTGEAVKATSTVDGYTGPTYSPSSSDSGSKDESSKTTLETSASKTATNAGAEETSKDKESTSGSASATTSSGSSASNATVTGEGASTNSGSGTPTPTSKPNGAAVNGAATGLVAMVFGAVALLM